MVDRKSFYRECYLQTGGWIPMNPLTFPIGLGDYCQIQNHQLAPLGNISNLNLLLEILVSDSLPLNPEQWKLSQGMRQLYQSKESYSEYSSDDDEHHYYSKQSIGFEKKGDFMFHGRAPQCRLIMNWNQFKDSITMSLTQSQFNFQELYVVTGVAVVKNWGLAISGGTDAQIELSADFDEQDFFWMLSHSTARAEKSSYISAFERSSTQAAHFFKAKKLVLKESRYDEFLAKMIEMSACDPTKFVGNWLNTNLINLLDREMLMRDSKTCIAYFDWQDATLDLVEKLA